MKETWRTHPDFDRYEVSDTGRVRVAGGRELAQRVRGTGRGKENEHFLRVDLAQDGVRATPSVHVLVLETFVGPRPSTRHVGAHRDGDRFENSLENLYWKEGRK